MCNIFLTDEIEEIYKSVLETGNIYSSISHLSVLFLSPMILCTVLIEKHCCFDYASILCYKLNIIALHC